VANDADEIALAAYLNAIAEAHDLSRQIVRDHAMDAFRTKRIVDTIVAGIELVTIFGDDKGTAPSESIASSSSLG
jgi:hypothetical protein